VRRAVTTVVLGLAAMVAAPRLARAQHCHVDVPEPSDPSGDGDGDGDGDAHAGHHGEHHHHHHGARAKPRPWWIGVESTMVAGAGSVGGVGRDYQGVAVGASGGWRRVSARAMVPAYRVADEGVGLGDALVALAADVVPGRGRVRAGLAASVSLPTGSSDAGRGMGHTMVAAGLWARVPAGRVRVDGAVVWARALGDGAEHAAHQHLAAMWPLVDPMNPEELVVDGNVTAGLAPTLRAGLGATYATPRMPGGAERLVTYALGGLSRGRYTFSTQLSVPLVGDPFVARGALDVSYRF
jgi:hypothetical protein